MWTPGYVRVHHQSGARVRDSHHQAGTESSDRARPQGEHLFGDLGAAGRDRSGSTGSDAGHLPGQEPQVPQHQAKHLRKFGGEGLDAQGGRLQRRLQRGVCRDGYRPKRGQNHRVLHRQDVWYGMMGIGSSCLILCPLSQDFLFSFET